VELKQGMTKCERQQELEQLYLEQPAEGTKDEDEDSDGEDKIHNPLKLPLARSDSGSIGYNECSWHRSDSRHDLCAFARLEKMEHVRLGGDTCHRGRFAGIFERFGPT
jgi:hypothetical protein